MEMNFNVGNENGLTVVEMVVMVGISFILMAALLRFLSIGFPISKITILQARSTETARLQLRRMSHVLRELRYSEHGAYPLVETHGQKIVFYADYDSDDLVERIRFELVGTDLVRGVVKPAGTPVIYDLATEEETIVARYVVNDTVPMFTYYTGEYPDDQTPLTPTDVTEVKYIQFRLMVDINPALDPPPIDIVSQVQIRNLKENL